MGFIKGFIKDLKINFKGGLCCGSILLNIALIIILFIFLFI